MKKKSRTQQKMDVLPLPSLSRLMLQRGAAAQRKPVQAADVVVGGLTLFGSFRGKRLWVGFGAEGFWGPWDQSWLGADNLGFRG